MTNKLSCTSIRQDEGPVWEVSEGVMCHRRAIQVLSEAAIKLKRENELLSSFFAMYGDLRYEMGHFDLLSRMNVT